MLCPRCGAEVGDQVRLCDQCQSLRADVAPPEVTAADLKAQPDESAAPPTAAPAPSPPAPEYAGFWLRYFAYLIDSFAVMLALFVAIYLLNLLINRPLQAFLAEQIGLLTNSAINSSSSTGFAQSEALTFASFATVVVASVLSYLILPALLAWLYYAGMESSAHQATFGKMAFGLAVTDYEYKRLPFGTASLRFMLKYLWLIIPLIMLLGGAVAAAITKNQDVLFGASIGAAVLSLPLFLFTFLRAAFSPEKQGLHDRIAGCYVIRRKNLPWTQRVSTAAGAVVLGILASVISRNQSVTVPEIASLTALPTPPANLISLGSANSAQPPVIPVAPATPTNIVPSVHIEGAAGHAVAGKASAALQSALAVYTRSENKLEVGLFEAPISEELIDRVRTEKSLFTALPARPELTVTFLFQPDSRACSTERLRNYTVTFYRGGKLDFPGTAEMATFNWAMNDKTAANLGQFNCVLSDNNEILASLKEVGITNWDKTLFSWNLKIKARIIDVEPELSESNAGQASGAAAMRAENKPAVPEGTVKAGSAEAHISSAVAIYYPRHSRLEVGFFTESLAENEIRALPQLRSLRTGIPGKAPVMTLTVKFNDEHPQADVNSIEEYFVNIYRESLGTFYFGGNRDFVTFQRSREKSAEFSTLEGSLADGGSINFDFSGKATSPFIANTEFMWYLKMKAPVITSPY